MNEQQNSIYKVIRFYNPNNKNQKLTNYYRGKIGGFHGTYLEYITRKEACILRSLDEKALNELNALKEWEKETRANLILKWKELGIGEKYLELTVKIIDNSYLANSTKSYGYNFKRKLFNELENEHSNLRKGITKEQENELWDDLLKLEKIKYSKTKWIEKLKKKEWGTGIYTNQAKYKIKGSGKVGELSNEEFKQLKKDFIDIKENDRLMWDTVLSFDSKFAEDNDVLIPEVMNKLIEANIDKLFKENNMDPKRMLWGFSMHGNTDNPHAHLFFQETKPNKKGEFRFKGSLTEESMSNFYKRAILSAQVNKLNNDYTKTIELEMKELLAQTITSGLFISNKEKFDIQKDANKFNYLNIQVNKLFLERDILAREADKEKSEKFKTLTKKLLKVIEQQDTTKKRLLELYDPQKINFFFSNKKSITPEEKELLEFINPNYIEERQTTNWIELKNMMVKNENFINGEHFTWFDTMKKYVTEKNKYVKYQNLNSRGRQETVDYVTNILNQTDAGSEMLKEATKNIEKYSFEIYNIAKNNIKDASTSKMSNLQILDNLEKIGLDINIKNLYGKKVDIDNVTEEKRDQLFINEIKGALFSGKDGFMSKQANCLFGEISNQKYQMEMKSPKTQKGKLGLGQISNSIAVAFSFGSKQASLEFDSQLKQMLSDVQKELKRFEMERKM